MSIMTRSKRIKLEKDTSGITLRSETVCAAQTVALDDAKRLKWIPQKKNAVTLADVSDIAYGPSNNRCTELVVSEYLSHDATIIPCIGSNINQPVTANDILTSGIQPEIGKEIRDIQHETIESATKVEETIAKVSKIGNRMNGVQMQSVLGCILRERVVHSTIEEITMKMFSLTLKADEFNYESNCNGVHQALKKLYETDRKFLTLNHFNIFLKTENPDLRKNDCGFCGFETSYDVAFVNHFERYHSIARWIKKTNGEVTGIPRIMMDALAWFVKMEGGPLVAHTRGMPVKSSKLVGKTAYPTNAEHTTQGLSASTGPNQKPGSSQNIMLYEMKNVAVRNDNIN